ncbi:MAG: T9SS C-terminal target domain-containing protein, partial [Chitinophagia bacterium]|nr:T9SS C-terminal target domain-containing protein [Chitinophagia bacterium]
VLAQNHNVLQVKELPAGVYYVTLRGTGGVSVRKLVKG